MTFGVVRRDERAEQLVRVIQINCEKIADVDVELSLDQIDRLQGALKRAYDANIVRLLARSLEVRATAEVGA